MLWEEYNSLVRIMDICANEIAFECTLKIVAGKVINFLLMLK